MGAISRHAKERRGLGPGIQAVVVILLVELSLAYLILGAHRTLTGSAYMNQVGNPIGADFVQYFSVSVLALGGEPTAAYDLSRLHQVEQRVIGAEVGPWPWHYPPTFMLVVLPMSLMPYLAALATWLLVGLGAYLIVVYRIAPHPATPFLALIFPAAADVLFSGQNGFLSAALLGGGLLLLERRPLLAGVLFGLLSYKPQLALLIPVALVAGGHWRGVGAAAGTTLAFAAASVAAFGVDPWLAFADNLSAARRMAETGASAWYKMPTVFAAARLLHASTGAAWALQGVATVAAITVVAWLWHRPGAFGLRASALVFAVPLATPYAQFYDLAVLALPIAWMAWEARTAGWLSGERIALAVLWTAPVAAWLLAEGAGVPAWPLILATMLALVLRRATRVASTTSKARAGT